jgi:glycosyltransferase involved in cell wall biosynthesis
MADVARLIPGQRTTDLLPLALREDLKLLSEDEQSRQLQNVRGLDQEKKFVLHVGSSHRRKNREGVLRVFAKVSGKLNAQLVFAGKPLEPSQRDLARVLGISGRIVEAGEVSNDLLAALYSKALAFLFPSRFEGFGWPIAEAQFCGCPVVCTNRDPFPEVAGEGALMRDVEDELGFAHDLYRIATEPVLRNTLIEKGFQNVQRYRIDVMISRYVALYQRVLRSQQEHNPAVVRAAA